MAFKLSRVGALLIVAAACGILFAAMPLMGLGADVSPDADSYLEQRYGNIGIGMATIWTVMMLILAGVGVVLQFRVRPARRPRTRR